MLNLHMLLSAFAYSICITVAANGAVPDINIGSATQVVNHVYGTLESSNQQRWWRAGLDIFHNEAVVTEEASASRVIFKDDSQLSIGPMSWLRLDNFVYDPNPATGALAISFVRGVFRFVSGKFSRENYRITTPAAFIGVRGTAFTVYILQTAANIYPWTVGSSR